MEVTISPLISCRKYLIWISSSLLAESTKLLEPLSFIGGGVMCEAMIRGLLSKKLLNPDGIMVAEPRDARRAELQQKHHVRVTADNREAVRTSKTIVLAVKPQDLRKVLAELKGALRPEQMVMSIVAGARINMISQLLVHDTVVRVMPNTPAQIGEGISVWTATSNLRETQLEQTRTILRALGKEVHMTDEKYLDMATAVSGTGPTYVFLVMEAMIDAAVHLGFPRHIAYELVTETIKGSIMFAMKSGNHPAELRNMVTSPGGTSAEALYQLEKGSLRTVLSKAIWAAYERSRALGEGNEKLASRE
jgi:pyrroline-5-carboxylate reductase